MSKNRKPVHGGNRGRARIGELKGISDFQEHDTTNAAHKQGTIERLLLVGESNAITAAALARITGQTPREVTRAIQRARLAGKPICASGTGFFLASDSRELARYVRGLDRRMREIRRTRDAVADQLTAEQRTMEECKRGE